MSYEIELYLIAWSDAVSDVIKIIENIVGKIHIGNTFLGNACQFGFIAHWIKRNDNISTDIRFNYKFFANLIAQHVGMQQQIADIEILCWFMIWFLWKGQFPMLRTIFQFAQMTWTVRPTPEIEMALHEKNCIKKCARVIKLYSVNVQLPYVSVSWNIPFVNVNQEK